MLIVGLYAWTAYSGISTSSSFYVSPLAAAIGAGSLILAGLAYFVVSEAKRTASTYAAYLMLLAATAALILTTGMESSPFIALWMIAAIFAGIFGIMSVGGMLVFVNVIAGYIFISGDMTQDLLLSILLAAELPLVVSFILWHDKSLSEKSSERAYSELANELSQVSDKAEVVINAINDGVIAINSRGQIELINPAAQRIVGWGDKDAIDLNYKSVLQLFSKDDKELDKSSDPVFDVLATNQMKERSDLRLQTNSGKKIMINLVVSPIGQIGSGAIIVFRDITKERAEEQAQAEFISTASHEMRTPVASIEGYLGLVLNPATATIDAKAREYITKAQEATQHLGHLFQDLLDVTKADDGRLSNNPKVIDIVSFTNDIIEGLRPKADQKNLRLFFKAMHSDDDPMRAIAPLYFVNADSDHLREVLSNLIENAIKYTPAGEVVVDVTGNDSHAVVSITDSGIGIPAEDVPHLFQKFYRVDNSATREINGTGLGLYLCRKFIEAMGGRIWVESEYKKGSTFSVELDRLSHDDASRMLDEAANAITPEITQTPAPTAVAPAWSTGETGTAEEEMTPQQKASALATPIIIDHNKPAGALRRSTVHAAPRQPAGSPAIMTMHGTATQKAPAPAAAPSTAKPAPVVPVIAKPAAPTAAPAAPAKVPVQIPVTQAPTKSLAEVVANKPAATPPKPVIAPTVAKPAAPTAAPTPSLAVPPRHDTLPTSLTAIEKAAEEKPQATSIAAQEQTIAMAIPKG